MSVRETNKQRKWLRCLKCGRKMLTDRCHRICKRCSEENKYIGGASSIRRSHFTTIRRGGESLESDDWQGNV